MARHLVTALSADASVQAKRDRLRRPACTGGHWRSSSVRTEATGVPVERLVRQTRQGRVHPSELDRTGPAARRVRRAPGHRHLQHLVGADARATRTCAQLAEHVKRGVWEAGGLPFEFPVMSLGETIMRPDRDAVPQPRRAWTSRSRSAPTRSTASCCSAAATRRRPSLVMGAASCDLPAHRRVGRADAERQVSAARTSARARRLEVQRGRQGRRDDAAEEFMDAEACMSRSTGTCMTMGTASTMASLVEALGRRAARQRGDPRGRLAALRAGAPRRPPHRRAGRGGRAALGAS